MRYRGLVVFCALLGFSGSAFAEKKDCDELKSEIEAKLQAKGVENYSLEIVDTESVGDEEIVGSCDGGTRKITYSRG